MFGTAPTPSSLSHSYNLPQDQEWYPIASLDLNYKPNYKKMTKKQISTLKEQEELLRQQIISHKIQDEMQFLSAEQQIQYPYYYDKSLLLQCDPQQEMFWCANGISNQLAIQDMNRITSYSYPYFQKYSSFVPFDPRHEQFKHFQVLSNHTDRILCQSNRQLKLFTKGGVLLQQFSDFKQHLDPQLLFFFSTSSHSMLLSGAKHNTLYDYDLQYNKLIKQIQTKQKIFKMSSNVLFSKCVALGGMEGGISLYDPRTSKIELSSEKVHSALLDMDLSQHYLVTCGLTERYKQYYPDTFVKVFDIRTLRLVNQIHFPPGPTALQYFPLYSKRIGGPFLCLLSHMHNIFQMRNVETDISASVPMQLSQEQESNLFLQSFCISPNGQVALFGDANANVVHVWNDIRGNTAYQNNDQVENLLHFEEEIQPLEFPKEEEQEETRIVEEEHFSQYGMIQQDHLLSNINASFVQTKRQCHVKRIHPQIMNHLKYSKRIGRVKNPGLAHEHLGYVFAKFSNKPIPFLQTIDLSLQSSQTVTSVMEQEDLFSEEKVVLNDTMIENNESLVLQIIPKEYQYLQIQTQFVKKFLSFDYSKFNRTSTFVGLENDLFYNTSFLWNNLIHIYCHLIPPLNTCCKNHLCKQLDCFTCQLGMLFTTMQHYCSHFLYQKGKTLDARNLIRIMETIPHIQQLHTTSSMSITMQELCKFALTQFCKELSFPLFDYGTLYPYVLSTKVFEQTSQKMSIAQILFGCEGIEKTKCLFCNYETVKSFSQVTTPLHNNNNSTTSFEKWIQQSIHHKEKQKNQHCKQCNSKRQTMEHTVTHVTLPNVFHFMIPTESGTALTICPYFITIYDMETFSWRVQAVYTHEESIIQSHWNELSKTSKKAIYECRAIVTHVKHPFDTQQQHVITFLKQKQEWYMFNDFCIQSVKAKEVFDFSNSWKVPVIAIFVRRELESLLPKIEYKNPFINYSSLKLSVSSQECIAMDCEFVLLLEKYHSNSKQTYGLGRVTLVKSDKHTILMDDYISISKNETIDYVTRFSGLQLGDLDPSRQQVTHLKEVQLKLRYLIELGVKFVGHGLKSDFKICNVIVPPNQIIDTVELFQLPRQRYLSLRYLAKHLLQKDIQMETHSSAEDALTALELYEFYCEHEEEMDQILELVYEFGRQNQWSLLEVNEPLQHWLLKK